MAMGQKEEKKQGPQVNFSLVVSLCSSFTSRTFGYPGSGILDP